MGEYARGFVVGWDDDGEIQYSVEFFLRHRIFPLAFCVEVPSECRHGKGLCARFQVGPIDSTRT